MSTGDADAMALPHGRVLPATAALVTAELVAFAASLVSDSGVAEALEGQLHSEVGRPRRLSVEALFVALVSLALCDRPLHLLAATRLLYVELPQRARATLGVTAKVRSRRELLCAYRRVRYLFHRVCHALAEQDGGIEEAIGKLVSASVRCATDEELSAWSGALALDATPVPLFSRGPSERTGRSAWDLDGGWYVREGDHRDRPGPGGRKLRKVFFALEATLATMGREPDGPPSHPNLIVGLALGRPGVDPGGVGVRVLRQVRRAGHPAGTLAADRGYTQCLPEHFHLPVRALGYALVMDYRGDDLGRQGEAGGALIVDGTLYCPAMPEALIAATAEHRTGEISDELLRTRLAARADYRLPKKAGPDPDGYERYTCPATGAHPHLCCPAREHSLTLGIGRLPVFPPSPAPSICCQATITVAPDVGARFRQPLTYGTKAWQRTYATLRNTIEGQNGYLKDPAHQSLAAPGRRRVRGLAAQSLFCAILVMAGNVRRLAAWREMQANGLEQQVVARARRRRTSLEDYRPDA
jgi:hypothetical protein